MYQGPDADQIYLPFYAYRQIDNRRRINQIHIQPHNADESKLIEYRIRTLLGRKYRFEPDDRYATSFWNTIEQQGGHGCFQGIEIFLDHRGADAAHRGGGRHQPDAPCRERTKEIGIVGHRRQAPGHRQQFLEGARFRCDVLGFITAFNIVHFIRLAPINYVPSGPGLPAAAVFSLRIFIAYLVIVGSLVFLSGIFPALRASRLNPIESLRYE
jgi:putative ABC transport system permease protein